MPKKEVRPDTHAWFFAAKIYVLFVAVFAFAAGSDIYHAFQAIEKIYGS